MTANNICVTNYDCKGSENFGNSQANNVSDGVNRGFIGRLTADADFGRIADAEKLPTIETGGENMTDTERLLTPVLTELVPIDFNKACGLPADSKKSAPERLKHVIVCNSLIEIAENLNCPVLKSDAGLFMYNKTHWHPLNVEELRQGVMKAAYLCGIGELEAKHYGTGNELRKQFESSAFQPLRRREGVAVNLLNGTLEVSESGEFKLRGHKENDHFNYVLNYEYDPNAQAPKFQRFLDRVLPDKSAQAVLMEYIGYVFYKDLKLEKALVLYGDGANGKSVFYDIISALLGSENISQVPLSELCDPNSTSRRLTLGKLVNYSSEIGSGKRSDHDTLKKMISGEIVSFKNLYHNNIESADYGRLVFNANKLPSDTEQTEAYFRRFLIVPFNVSIPESEQNPNLAKEIIADELSGVLNMVLGGLKRLVINKKFTTCEAARQANADYRRESDSVAMFLEDENFVKSDKHYKLGDLYGKRLSEGSPFNSNYKDWCISNGYKPCGSKEFSRRLTKLGHKPERNRIGMVVYLDRQTDIDTRETSNAQTSELITI